MTEPQRWIATVDSDGRLLETTPYPGPDDDGSKSKETTYGTHYQYVARTKDDAERGALRDWDLAQ